MNQYCKEGLAIIIVYIAPVPIAVLTGVEFIHDIHVDVTLLYFLIFPRKCACHFKALVPSPY